MPLYYKEFFTFQVLLKLYLDFLLYILVKIYILCKITRNKIHHVFISSNINHETSNSWFFGLRKKDSQQESWSRHAQQMKFDGVFAVRFVQVRDFWFFRLQIWTCSWIPFAYTRNTYSMRSEYMKNKIAELRRLIFCKPSRVFQISESTLKSLIESGTNPDDQKGTQNAWPMSPRWIQNF